ncbi:MAG TPA: hypothetical protein ENI68_02475 [Gammaproteobacteria bacterium]|nr:hypothetical protein [Gammaproteobacteria bacterium]
MSIKSNQETHNADDRTSSELHQVLTGMQDALTDEMVSRLVQTLSSGAGLLDQLGRSGADKAMPLLAEMIENGDLARVAQLARLLGAAQDSVTDEMIVRLTDLISGAMTLLDHLNRSGLDRLVVALPRMVEMFERLEQEHVVDDLMHSLDKVTATSTTPARGGLKGLWSIARAADTQEALSFLLLLSKQFRTFRAVRQATRNSP